MDRQDIDALLIGALYGELTPADEARLATHLDSHPADRGALDDLRVARQAVVDSRIFAVQLDPPQAVSALLLQEAHRRAPKYVAAPEEKESWFFRFTRTFLAHPAMAAAAMLVLVLGGAGIMYMKKGDQFAAREVSSPSSLDQVAAAPSEAPAAQAAAAGSGSAMTAGLYEGAAGTASISADPADKAAESASDRWEGQKADAARDELAAAQTKLKKAAPTRGITVGTDKGMVKELERAKGAKNDSFGFDGDSAGSPGAASGGGAGRSASGASTGATFGRADGNVEQQQGYAQPPPSAAPATMPNRTATSTPRAPAPAPAPTADAKAPAKVATSTTKPAPEKPSEATVAPAPKVEAKPDSSLIAWAKGEHARAVSLAQKGECTAAAKLALGVSSRASDYYAQYMATDRSLKQCAQYINAEREKDAEKSAKSRAQKRTNADEAAPSPAK